MQLDALHPLLPQPLHNKRARASVLHGAAAAGSSAIPSRLGASAG